MTLNDKIHIKRVNTTTSEFGAGVIQYAVSYFDKYE
jgi:hypothetical protein